MLIGILIGLAIAGLAYLLYRLTVAALKRYRQKQQSKIVLGDMKDMIKNCPNKDKYSFSELEEIKNEKIVAEYDPYSDEIVKADFVGKDGMDYQLENAVNKSSKGMIIIED